MENSPDPMSYQATKKQKRHQKKNREIAREILYGSPGQPEVKALWLWNGQSKRVSSSVTSEIQNRIAVEGLWRAEKRFRLGSYAAILDTFAICCEHGWPFPNWVSETTADVFGKALFEPKRVSASYPQRRRYERSRIQRQKHCQLFYTIKQWSERSKWDETRRSILLADELSKTDPQDILGARTDHERADIVARVLPRAQKGQPKNNADAVLESVKRNDRDSVDLFGVTLGYQLDPAYFLWDIPFVLKQTMLQLDLPY